MKPDDIAQQLSSLVNAWEDLRAHGSIDLIQLCGSMWYYTVRRRALATFIISHDLYLPASKPPPVTLARALELERINVLTQNVLRCGGKSLGRSAHLACTE